MRLEENPKVDLHYRIEITGLDGAEHLERLTWRDRTNGGGSERAIRHVFIRTGASPRTELFSISTAICIPSVLRSGHASHPLKDESSADPCGLEKHRLC